MGHGVAEFIRRGQVLHPGEHRAELKTPEKLDSLRASLPALADSLEGQLSRVQHGSPDPPPYVLYCPSNCPTTEAYLGYLGIQAGWSQRRELPKRYRIGLSGPARSLSHGGSTGSNPVGGAVWAQAVFVGSTVGSCPSCVHHKGTTSPEARVPSASASSSSRFCAAC